MGRKEYLLEGWRELGALQMGVKKDSSSAVNPPLTREQINRLERKFPPPVRERISHGLEGFSDELKHGNELGVYQASLQTMAAIMFGKQGLYYSFNRPPKIHPAEQRYLTVIGNIGRNLRDQQFNDAKDIIEGTAFFSGYSNPDTGRPPCHPEILICLGTIADHLEPIFLNLPSEGIPKTFTTFYAEGIDQLVEGFKKKDRRVVVQTQMDLGDAANQLLRHAGTVDKFSRFHPQLGRFINAILNHLS